MTIVLGVSSYTDGFMVSDCRLTYGGQPTRYRDFCQKLFTGNGWSVVGIAGDLCLIRDIALGVIARLGETSWDSQKWLRDDAEFVDFLKRGFFHHRRQRHQGGECTCGAAEMLVAWMDYSRRTASGEWIKGPPSPDPRLIEVRIRNSQCRHRRVRRGAAAIGRDSGFASIVNTESFDELVTYFGRYVKELNIGDAQRALIATTEVHKHLVAHNKMHGIGGLYQVMTFGPRGVQAVPYFYLADVCPGYRTYVAMRIDRGEWVQEHRPTGRQVRVKHPWAIDLDARPRLDSIFDPARDLAEDSPGVIAARDLEVVFSLYDPPNVPDAVQPSWGLHPLTPLSFG